MINSSLLLKNKMRIIFFVFIFSLSIAGSDLYEFSDQSLEDSFIELSKEISCPLCAGSSIAESDSDIAIDLKKVIFQDLKNGSSPQEIKNKLMSIYGEGILFMPQNKISLFFLYAFPLLLTFIGLILLLKFLRK